MWLVRELVKSGVLGADGVCMTFMKQIAGELDGKSIKKKEVCTMPKSRQWRMIECLRYLIPGLFMFFPFDPGIFWPRMFHKEIEKLQGAFWSNKSCLIFLPAKLEA